NCNSAYDPPYPDPACKCTDSNPASCQNSPRQLCLDNTATVAAIQAAYNQHNIRTIVVGFGAETASGDGPLVLEAMAKAGGFPRTCPSGTNAECGTGTCDAANKTCSPSFYQAANAADLARVLANIAKKVSQAPCDYLLDVTPSDPNFISVLVNGTSVPRGSDSWIYLGPGGDGGASGKVQLVGSLCTQAKAATPDTPVQIEIRLLRTF
ncbi:MAG TPA: adventurous gliding motility lipoprotein CglB, partial [Myxococcaceae bacterium]|nr:adventurous gliding motility lipoprotein CglB [Myxococcaceae bacterium]